ncbi:IS1182 family transposase [Desulfopila sp. IMCC35006]|uniref:transposase n=1 Tax=Desulfopila sp. IMCC35006 TaxID=2569542 RepID=UPI0010AD7409|nr:transposase [Desulfopila sp. IMCC35006]TKB23292.1 IS1182 family transposase [Desulfopila sp. IMCC35006]
MAKYKPYSYAQGQFIPVFFNKQIQEGTFEYSLSYLVDNELDLSIFDKRFNNDETGAPAYDPRILLKVVLFAYSRGITSSRAIARCCEENVLFMALSANSKPHFTTIADFISSMDKEIAHLFLEVLLVCDQQKLIGKEMFAIDGCKLPSNAAKEWSGTKADFQRKVAKMEKAIATMIAKHRAQDDSLIEPDVISKEKKYLAKLKKQAAKIKEWLDDNDDRTGSSGKPIKSNITDNESAKMKTSKGVIQGYVGVTSVGKKHQVIVGAEAFGQGQEHNLLIPMIEKIRENFSEIGHKGDVLHGAQLAADSGYHSEKNMEYIFQEKIDGYIADTNFRKRDPRFVAYDRFKDRYRREMKPGQGGRKIFAPADFVFPADFSYCLFPGGKKLYRSGGNARVKNYRAIKFKGAKRSCLPCKLRRECLRYPNKTGTRQVAYFTGKNAKGQQRFTERMKRKIDTAIGRAIYSMRLAVGEPPFAHIRSVLGLDKFTLRTKRKVSTQWNLFCIVHNLKKIHSHGVGFV